MDSNTLDKPLRERFVTAYRSDARLCFVGRFDEMSRRELELQRNLRGDVQRHATEGAYDVYLLRGNCLINQGLTYARSSEAVKRVRSGKRRTEASSPCKSRPAASSMITDVSVPLTQLLVNGMTTC